MSRPSVDYDNNQHAVYAKARSISGEMLSRWMSVFAEQLPARRPLTILDLGSGTGRFSPALAATFGGPVHGVEPSDRMRAVAEAASAAPNVRYVAGEAARIPLPDASVDGVLMFLSFHHVPDKRVAAREIARVLKADGRVLMRGQFSDRRTPAWYSRYFPSLATIEQTLFPTLGETLEAFEAVGLRQLAFLEIEEVYHQTEAEAVEKLRMRGISAFDLIAEDEATAGFAALDADLAAGRATIRLTGRSDLLVLGR